MYLEDITESWKAESSEKTEGTQFQDTSRRVSGVQPGLKKDHWYIVEIRWVYTCLKSK